MLKFVTKADYWKHVDAGVELYLAKAKFPWHLKSIQDVIAMSYLHALQGKKIAEVGGSYTRILQHLAPHNTCFNIDKFDGSHGGSSAAPEVENVNNILCYLGADSHKIPDNSFDVLFSVSVVEHLADAGIEEFFAEQFRVVKPGAFCVHLIDVYLDESSNSAVKARVGEYARPFHEGQFAPMDGMESVLDPHLIKFETSYATNPDNIMMVWNKAVPKLRPLRELAQSCSLIWAGHKI